MKKVYYQYKLSCTSNISNLLSAVRFFVSSRCPQTNPEECGSGLNSDPGSNKKKVNQQMNYSLKQPALQQICSVTNQQPFDLNYLTSTCHFVLF